MFFFSGIVAHFSCWGPLLVELGGLFKIWNRAVSKVNEGAGRVIWTLRSQVGWVLIVSTRVPPSLHPHRAQLPRGSPPRWSSTAAGPASRSLPQPPAGECGSRPSLPKMAAALCHAHFPPHFYVFFCELKLKICLNVMRVRGEGAVGGHWHIWGELRHQGRVQGASRAAVLNEGV